MSYKEKSAWVMCLALMLGALFYGYAVLGMTAQTAHSPLTGIVVIYVLIIVLISIVGHIIAALVSVDEAEAVADERDKLVSVRANSASSHILGLGVITGVLMYLLGGDGDLLFHFALVSLTLSSIAEYALKIYFYRSGV